MAPNTPAGQSGFTSGGLRHRPAVKASQRTASGDEHKEASCVEADAHTTTRVLRGAAAGDPASGVETLAAETAATAPTYGVPAASEAVSAAPAPYRVARVDVKTSDAVDQIKITYTDNTVWSVGHDAGKNDQRAVILTPGEYLVRVTHERFLNHKCAGAAVEFASNKGRVFKYHPSSYTTRWQSEQTTLRAAAGMEIIALTVRHGVLLGIQEQPVPEAELVLHAEEWWTVATCVPSNAGAGASDGNTGCTGGTHAETTTLFEPDDATTMTPLVNDPANGDGSAWCVQYRHFTRKAAAQLWRQQISASTGARGGATLLTNTMDRKLVANAGCAAAVDEVVARAQAYGLWAPKHDRDVGLRDALFTLIKLLHHKRDAWTLAAVFALLMASFYFELESKVLTGQVVTIAGDTVSHDVASNAFTRAACACLGAAVTDRSCADDVFTLRLAAVVAFVCVRALASVLDVVNIYIHHSACDHKTKQLEQKAFRHVMGLDQTYFDTHATSDIDASMNVHSLCNLITWNAPYIVSKSIKLVMVACFLMRIDVAMGSIAVAAMVFIKFCILEPLSRREKLIHKVSRKLDVLLKSIKFEAFGMITSVKLFSREQQHLGEYKEATERRATHTWGIVFVRCVRELAYHTAQSLTFGIILIVGVRQLASTNGAAGGAGAFGSHLSSASLTAFFLLLQELLQTFNHVKWHYQFFIREFGDIERFLTLMEAQSTMPVGTKRVDVHGDVKFKNVTFEYPTRPGEHVLDGLNLSIRANRTTAIVGDSGAGKSTISKLIMRLYDPCEGTVTIDGVDLRELDVEHYHGQVAIVNQNPTLFNASIADNIAFGAAPGSDTAQLSVFATEELTKGDRLGTETQLRAEVEAAAKLANCHEFVTGFRAGYDTFAGTAGASLSGGQKQRIAIARAAMRKPKLLILDEATSSLDAENEALVQQAIDNIMRGRTTVIIAHRLSTIKSADDIVCMRGGKVVERGTHDELMRLDGVYANLVRRQVFDGSTDDA